MNITTELWTKVLKIRDSYLSKDKHLSRSVLEKELEGVCNSRDVRMLHDILRSLPVILRKGGVNAEARLLDKVSSLSKQNKDLTTELIRVNKIAELTEEIRNSSISIPMLSAESTSTQPVTACSILSDTHFDEVVDGSLINNINHYNRQIATQRLQKYFHSLIKLKVKYFSTVNIEHLVLMLAGDMVSGIIHDELKETNEYAITETLVYYVEQMAAGIKLLAQEYDKISIPCVVGNHGRLTPKVKYKGSVKDNFDYLFYCMLRSALKGEKKVEFFISDSTDALVKIYDTTFLLNHGNDFRGGNGWGGPAMPVMRGDMRKRVTYDAVDLPYDVLCTAHFHTMKFLGDQIMSGSLVGYSEYALRNGCKYEPPQLPFWLVHPKYGVTITAPVHCGE